MFYQFFGVIRFLPGSDYGSLGSYLENEEKRAYFFEIIVIWLVSDLFAMDVKPNHTIYINNLNEKTKKEGWFCTLINSSD